MLGQLASAALRLIKMVLLVSVSAGGAQADANEARLLKEAVQISKRHEAVGLKGLTHKQRVFHLVWQLEAEVNNGGFDQFFFNSSGDEWRETLDALQDIGAMQTKALLSKAVGVFEGGEPPVERERRQMELLKLSKSDEATLSKLDSAFFAYPDDLDLPVKSGGTF